jgi:hypothetical protein
MTNESSLTHESSALAPASAFVNLTVLGFDHFAGTKKGNNSHERELDQIFFEMERNQWYREKRRGQSQNDQIQSVLVSRGKLIASSG